MKIDVSPQTQDSGLLALRSDAYERALRIVLEAEGGLNTSTFDRGNRGGNVTNYGVTQATYNDWRKEKGFPTRSTRKITLEEVSELYYEDFWLASGSNLLPHPLNIIHFDAAVNSGPRQAIRFLQRALGINEDGIIGPRTRRAYMGADKRKLLGNYIHIRKSFYQKIALKNNNAHFINGWLNRLSKLPR